MGKITDPALLAHLNGGDSPGIVQIGGGDPKMPGAIAAQEVSTARTRQQMGQDAAISPFAIRKAMAEALAAELAADKARRERSGIAPLSPDRRAELTDRGGGLRNMERTLTQLESLYKTNMAGQPMTRGFGLAEYLPTPKNQQFDKLAKQMGPYMMAALGLTGKSVDAAAEYKQKVEPFIPSSWDSDQANAQTLANLREMLNEQKRSTYGQLGTPTRTRRIPNPIKPTDTDNDGWSVKPLGKAK